MKFVAARSLWLIAVILITVSVSLAGELVLINEDFEAGLDAWSAKAYRLESNFDPTHFDETGAGMYGDNGNHNGTKSAGFSSNLPDFDGTNGNWIQMQWPAAIPAGSYSVTLEMDVYVCKLNDSDPWGVGNRTYVLTNGLYDQLDWNFDGGIPANQGVEATFWPGRVGDTTDWSMNGVWRHVTIPGAINTTTGDIELRLLMHDKRGGPQTVAWDNVELTIGNGSNPELFVFTEDFEAENALDAWTVRSTPFYDDTPVVFGPNDPRLLGDMDSPGSDSAGYASNATATAGVAGPYLQQLFPEAIEPGTYTIRLQLDWYVKKDHSNPWGVGNRIYFLYDNLYDQPTWNFDTNNLSYGFALDRWNGYPDPAENGHWLHLDIEQEITTTTGNFEFRLLMHNKFPGPQAVAWDNVRLSIVIPCNEVAFDIDADGDVDHEDFGIFQLCYTGDSGIGYPRECACFDHDNDTDVDSIDFAAFTDCASAPMVLADPACDDVERSD